VLNVACAEACVEKSEQFLDGQLDVTIESSLVDFEQAIIKKNTDRIKSIFTDSKEGIVFLSFIILFFKLIIPKLTLNKNQFLTGNRKGRK
jgi:hypothetical protein